MNRTIEIGLNKVSPVPATLRPDPTQDIAANETIINLGQLFLQYYFDSFPSGPPNPDPSRFEYLELVNNSEAFRFHAYVGDSSTVKKRALSTEIGQAFCRLLLHDHFRIAYFAHMADVIGKPTHAAFAGMTIRRTTKGDVPDYLCARSVSAPCIAEAKGRFSSISFSSADFTEWRSQFTRIRVAARDGSPRRTKGYIVATRFATDMDTARVRSKTFIEDPETEGAAMQQDELLQLGRGAMAMHYARVLTKLGLNLFASALRIGYSLTRELTFQVPVWTCMTPPFQGARYIGGYYRTLPGVGPNFSREHGWVQSTELGASHSVFIGLDLNVALRVSAAARGDWRSLDEIPLIQAKEASSSEFAWLLDGTVAAPIESFLPTGFQLL
jgi:hypothetical protein